jgi:rod shape determining protein RodA
VFDIRRWRHFDFWLLGSAAFLVIFGIAMIRSAIAGNETLAGYPQRQAIFAGIGLFILLVATMLDYHVWRGFTRPIYIGILGLLLFLEITGSSSFGAARWFNLGFIQVQPSELAKVLLVVIIADEVARNEERMKTWPGILRTMVIAAIPAVIIFLQPDLSTAILTMVIWAALAFAAGMPVRNFLLLGVGAVLAPVAALLLGLVQDYMKKRLTMFLAPDADPSAMYNVKQAFVSIASGGWFGQGYGSSTQVQLRFLKVRQTDFIFSSMTAEFGVLGAVVIFIVLGFIVYRCLRAARMARDTYGALIAYGVATLVFYQAAFNIGMNLNLLPVAGLPLPFISYGGSTLWSVLFGIGLVESTVIYRKEIEF